MPKKTNVLQMKILNKIIKLHFTLKVIITTLFNKINKNVNTVVNNYFRNTFSLLDYQVVIVMLIITLLILILINFQGKLHQFHLTY